MDIWHHIVLFFSHLWSHIIGLFVHAWFWVKEYIESHPEQTLWIAVIVAFLEALPVLGTVFPGSVTMTLVGIFAGRGLVPIGETVLWTTVGALAGDCVGYILGRVFCDKIPRYWPFKTRPHWLANGRKFFDKHGGKSVILGRFVGPARSTVPMIAGVFQMTWGRFVLAAIPSAFLWAVAYLIPGILVGAVSLQMTPKQTTVFLAIALLVIVCLWFSFWLIQRCYNWLSSVCNRFFGCLWAGLLRTRSTSKLCHWLAPSGQAEDPSPLERIVWAVIAFAVFIFLLICVLQHNSIAALNLPVFNFIQSIRYPALDSFFVVLTLIGSPTTLLVLTLVIALQYVVQRNWKNLFFWVLGIAVVAALVGFFKFVVHEPRPTGFNFIAKTNGFPSGHTALSTIVFGLLGFWTTMKLSSGWRSAWRILSVILILSVGVSRLYLGPHWLWDVVGGWAAATAVWLLVNMLYRRTPPSKKIRWQAIGPWVSLLLVLLVCGSFVWDKYARELYRTSPHWVKRNESFQGWLRAPHTYIPQFLDNRIGKPYLPMNIQWAGKLKCVRKQLEKMGWHKAKPAWDIRNLIKRLTLKQAKDHLPILNRRFQGKAPDVVYIKQARKPANVLEIYLWSSGLNINQINSPVLVGFINQRNSKGFFRRVSSAKKIHYRAGNIAQHFVSRLGGAYAYKKIEKPSAINGIRHDHGWGGDTWLIFPSKRGSQACP